ncbi:hypothetical protein BLX87_15995 [Bacillus sp. VT-16-64]|nr:hypothetical protein BLX87_15995 [Bacillus sp. VT-16-64]
MRVILVDDEALALEHMEHLLVKISGVEIVGKFQNPFRALEASLRERPDVIFLDIDMPEINGIEIAEQIQSSYPEILVVFVTAYDEYAVKAFEINAMDYVIKPVQRTRLVETVRRLKKRVPSQAVSSDGSGIVCCFQTLQFKRSMWDSEFVDVYWRTSKARELFSFLIQHRGRPVRKDILLDMLWPEVDDKKGYAQLYAAIYQIRRTLSAIQMNITISSLDHSYVLELNEVKLDVDEWQNGMAALTSGSDENVVKHQNLLTLYRGDYLAEEGYLWAESERERLRILWLHYINMMTDHFVSNGKYTEAILLYRRVQVLHPYVDSSYFMLMKLYDLLGDHHSVEQQYKHLRNMLKEEYDMKPKPTIEKWYEKWKSEMNRHKNGDGNNECRSL